MGDSDTQISTDPGEGNAVALELGEDAVDPFVTRLKDGIASCVLWAQVLLVTVCMAYAETTDLPMLALCSVSVVSLGMLELRKLF